MDEHKRRQIVHGVWQVIVEQGLDAVSFRSVAAAAGVSAGRVQHYFSSKQELVRASASELLDAAADTTPQALGDPGDDATLEALLLHTLEPASESRAGTSIYYSYVAASVTDPWIAALLADAKASVFHAVEACLLARHPDLPHADAHARHLTLLADGATQAVFVGAITAADARRLITHEIDRFTPESAQRRHPSKTPLTLAAGATRPVTKGMT